MRFSACPLGLPMPQLDIPDLSLSGLSYGSAESPWTLQPLLFKGGACLNFRDAQLPSKVQSLGEPDMERFPLVVGLHSVLQAEVVKGTSRHTVKAKLYSLRRFLRWADAEGRTVNRAGLRSVFNGWLDHLADRHRVARTLNLGTAADQARNVALLFDAAFETTELLGLCRKLRSGKRRVSTSADTFSHEDAFRFGHMLQDIIGALAVDAIRGSLPIRIELRTGQTLEEWSRLTPSSKLKPPSPGEEHAPMSRQVALRRAAWEEDTTRRTRYPLINLRVEAELLTFVAQTGMNFSQAYRLKAGSFTFQSHPDGYLVRRIFKERRQGVVEFRIFGEYRSAFKRYLDWREVMFAGEETDLLFPLWAPHARRSKDQAPLLLAVRKRCLRLGIPFVGPRTLRHIRVNWLMRRSRDAELTAEMAQHSQETLLRHYHRPSHQVALIEISRFHAAADPAFAAPGPGVCAELRPEEAPGTPLGAPMPDCISPAGCLFCAQQRDIDSADHAWSLASYRALKILELTRSKSEPQPGRVHPAYAAISRITEKLAKLGTMSSERASWVAEAEGRIKEGEFHPKWDGFIRLAEIGS